MGNIGAEGPRRDGAGFESDEQEFPAEPALGLDHSADRALEDDHAPDPGDVAGSDPGHHTNNETFTETFVG